MTCEDVLAQITTALQHEQHIAQTPQNLARAYPTMGLADRKADLAIE